MNRCEYVENSLHCQEQVVLDVKMLGRTVHLCSRHARPEFHPPDLRKKLPAGSQI